MRATTLVRTGLIVAGLVAIVGCRPVLVNVPEPGHGVIGTGVNEPPVISDRGGVIAFTTADFLTAEDQDGTGDVYARDLRQGRTQLMSVSPGGAQDGCGSSNPQVSGDGRYVAYSGCSSEVVPPPPGTVTTSSYVKDRVTGGLEQIGIPEEAGIVGGGFEFLDYDGSHVALWCSRRNAPDNTVSVCVQDRHTLDTQVVSVRTDGQTVDAFAVPASISDNGRLVAFVAPVADVVPGSTDTRRQLFVRDVAAGVTRPVVIDPAVLSGDAEGRLSGDGTAAVVWQTAPPYHVVHKDLVTGAVRRVDRGASDVTSPATYGFATISNNGDVVAFQSSSDSLVPHDTNGVDDVFVWHARVPWFVLRISVGPRFHQGDGESYWPAISGDGSSVAFVSQATNLVRDDTNGAADAFFVELAPRWH